MKNTRCIIVHFERLLGRPNVSSTVICAIIIIIMLIPIKLIYNRTRLVVLFTTMIGKGRSLKTVHFVCRGSGMPWLR